MNRRDFIRGIAGTAVTALAVGSGAVDVIAFAPTPRQAWGELGPSATWAELLKAMFSPPFPELEGNFLLYDRAMDGDLMIPRFPVRSAK